MNKKIVIAIDGHSSCGKSTVAKDCAKLLGYIYVDTGAMYRAVTLYAINNNLFSTGTIDTQRLIELLPEIDIDFSYSPESQKSITLLNGVDVESEIRSMKVSDKVSYIAAVPEVRQAMVKQQQAYGTKGGVIMDGRDIGTVVFPNADLKIFMTASVEVRSERRYRELIEKGDDITLESVVENITKRDYIDQNREDSPSVQADDATVLDNSNITKEEQLNYILNLVSELTK